MILNGESGIPNLSSRQRTIFELVKTGASIPRGTLNNSASILSEHKLLAFVKYGGPKEGVAYTITEAGELALSSGKYAP